jgi:hypothetical protein
MKVKKEREEDERRRRAEGERGREGDLGKSWRVVGAEGVEKGKG